MDKKLVGLIGAVTALTVPQAVQALPSPTAEEIMRVQSYGDLLNPIANARELLRVADSAPASTQPNVRVAQYHHHHHHHHHSAFFDTSRSS